MNLIWPIAEVLVSVHLTKAKSGLNGAPFNPTLSYKHKEGKLMFALGKLTLSVHHNPPRTYTETKNQRNLAPNGEEAAGLDTLRLLDRSRLRRRNFS